MARRGHEAARVAQRAIVEALASLPIEDVRFVLFSPADVDAYARALRQELGEAAGEETPDETPGR